MYVACEETYYPCQELGFQNLLFEISVKKKKKEANVININIIIYTY